MPRAVNMLQAPRYLNAALMTQVRIGTKIS